MAQQATTEHAGWRARDDALVEAEVRQAFEAGVPLLQGELPHRLGHGWDKARVSKALARLEAAGRVRREQAGRTKRVLPGNAKGTPVARAETGATEHARAPSAARQSSKDLRERMDHAKLAVAIAVEELETVEEQVARAKLTLRQRLEMLLLAGGVSGAALDDEALEAFAAEPYVVLPSDKPNEWNVVAPRFLPDFHIGFLKWSSPSYNVFAVNRYAQYFGDIPADLAKMFDFKPALDARVADGMVTVASKAEQEEVVARYGDLIRARKGDTEAYIKPGREFDLIAKLVRDGTLPFVPRGVAKDHLRAPEWKPGAEVTLRAYQQKGWETFLKFGATGYYWPTGCHARGQEVLMFDGSTKRVEDVEVGDLLMGMDSTPRRVLSLRRGREEMARIVPAKGESFVVNRSHILSLVRTNEGVRTDHLSRMGRPKNAAPRDTVYDMTVNDWLAMSKYSKHIHKLFRVGVEYPEAKLPVDPYFVGAYLGDGGGTTKRTVLYTADEEMRAMVEAEAKKWGLTVTVHGEGTCKGYAIVQGAAMQRHTNPLTRVLRDLGLFVPCEEKRVPNEYKSASREQRLQLLAGLIDTDGSLDKCGYDFVSKSPKLAADVAYVARSLGMAAYVKPAEKRDQNSQGGTYHRVHISGACHEIPVRIPRKRAPVRVKNRDVLRTGFTVELLPEDDYYGFTVDGDHRYLLADFTVTHNSGKTYPPLRAFAELKGRKLVLVPNNTLVEQWRERIALHLTSQAAAQVEVYTYQAYNSIRNQMRNKGWVDPVLIVYDEAHHLPADTFSKWATVPCLYRMGLSASAYREDGRTDLIIALTGMPVGADWRELEALGVVEYPDVFLHVVPDLAAKLRALDALVKAKDGGRTIVFCDGKDMGYALGKKYDVPFVSGDVKKGRLDVVREALAAKSLCVVSRVGDEGLSLPNLDRVVEFEFHAGSRRQEVQRMGRVMHGQESKGEHHILMTKEDEMKHSKRLMGIRQQGIRIQVVRA